ncbi:thymidine phosphorylase family protein [Motiliproteus sediminis]|uniref:thymidine phosphorylase family protein n=1 Tax=Motiliproteus sediminis TaxID=1468178 RepID=UPI001AF00CB2|nr:thymidine phosphorylase family protein [Motiliproteus sediminis]
MSESNSLFSLQARRLGIDTHQEHTVYLRADSHVCHSEGFTALSRVRVRTGRAEVVATLHIVRNGLLRENEIGLSDSAWQQLALEHQEPVWVTHPKPLESLSHLRAKVFGKTLDREQIHAIITDIAAGLYADVHLAAFITACSDGRLNLEEITYLTEAMVNAGSRLHWPQSVVADKHCVGGLPGNRTTPLVVSIVTCFGLTMPKTSSRAITSPAGTADTMETLTEVALTLEQMQTVVRETGGCLAWGGSVRLSPADDLLIRVERALDIDSEGQLIASVLSKKIAAGATHVLIDIPIGSSAKVRDREAAERLSGLLQGVADALGLTLKIVVSDGSQPIGRGIGPALEARDVLAVLRNEAGAPGDLRQRAAELAGALLEMCDKALPGNGKSDALAALEDGRAWTQFQRICEAQGGLREPPMAPYLYKVQAPHSGRITHIDNRLLAQVAKLAGAPADPAAGITLYKRLGERVSPGETLLSIHAESPGELDYAVEFLNNHRQLFTLV